MGRLAGLTDQEILDLAGLVIFGIVDSLVVVIANRECSAW